jgi:transcriptional regulator with XRE-family HTH domain
MLDTRTSSMLDRPPVSWVTMLTRGDRIRLRMKAVGIRSQAALGRKVGKPRSTVNLWISGKTKNIGNMNFDRLVDVLETTEDWLLHERDRNCDAEGRRLRPAPESTDCAGKFQSISPEIRHHLQALIELLAWDQKTERRKHAR